MSRRFFSFSLAVALAIPAGATGSALAQKAKPKAKKVWTNEDLEELQLRAPISVVGPAFATGGTAKEEKKSGSTETTKGKDAQSYREQLAPLRNELDRVTQQIQQLRTALANPASTQQGLRLGSAVSPILLPQDQLDQLNKRAKELQEHIETIEDQARRKGIEPSTLR